MNSLPLMVVRYARVLLKSAREQDRDKLKRLTCYYLSNNEFWIGKGKYPEEVKSNITIPESVKMTTSKGLFQGYNGVAVVEKSIKSLLMLRPLW